ncbi:flagellar basal body P-ring formation chaperone FlgA [Xenophilus arseniciresistens]|uniref:Flagellar basal body P-ring formation chaperone FlgA n=1 Tax=Xenophilus arseniciresistens TaxID=1283306 RepID=A0AAE3SXT0_9BURK|nr:flagellar basal body P-ring formation chaperone FlgA [Xenophilus arseniciresistens]MDA7415249.1 flagellar basal body P-ring formation chaperone FlgA [Xenophilus arseniciresistens]
MPAFVLLRHALSGLALAAAMLAGAQALAQPQAPAMTPAASEAAPDFVAATQQWLDAAVDQSRANQSTPLRMEVSLGALDGRLRLAPCARVEPYIPAGARLWGRSRLGLRCVDGQARWNVFLPVTVKAFGPAWVLRDNVLPGAVLGQDDAVEAQADWAAEPSPVVADPAQWVGQVASRSLLAGQPLRQSMIKPAQAFAAGSAVRVVAKGPGFEITSVAQALTAGVVGQMVRIRMDNGRMTTGVVQDAHTVQLAL